MASDVKTMDIKKVKVSSSEKARNVESLKEYVADVKAEITKIHWTSRSELLAYTKIVVLSTLIFGMSIYFVDMLIQTLLASLSYLLQIIAG